MDIKKALADIAAAADAADAVAKRKREAGIVDRASGRAEGLREAHRIVTAMVTQTAPVPVERTPETVLRAMLRAYEKAALEVEVEYFRSAEQCSCAVETRRKAARRATSRVREELAAVIAEAHLQFDWPHPLHLDYEARLAGTTPLDAPPAEGT